MPFKPEFMRQLPAAPIPDEASRTRLWDIAVGLLKWSGEHAKLDKDAAVRDTALGLMDRVFDWTRRESEQK